MKYVFSGSPQIKTSLSTRAIMLHVCVALLPSCVVGCVLFGWGALLVLAISTLSAVAAEVFFRLCQRVPFAKIMQEMDFTSAVTGLLVGMNMYADSKWYAVMLSSVFAVVVVKMLFGGTGKNVVNPAVVGRIFGFMSFGAAFGGTIAGEEWTSALSGGSCVSVTDSVTVGATPMQALFGNASNVTNTLTNLDLLIGTGVYGTIGEVCKLALIVGGVYLVVMGVIDFRWSIVYIGVAGLTAVALAGFDFSVFLPSILSGGLILGAIFMATDYVTSPTTKAGNYIYYICLGVLTSVLRSAIKGEAVSFAILLMNLVVPLIDAFVLRKPFGYVKQKGVNNG